MFGTHEIKEEKAYQYSMIGRFCQYFLGTSFVSSCNLSSLRSNRSQYRSFSHRDSRVISLIVSGIAVSNTGAGGIPVGIAVARQRLQHQETSTSMRNVSLSHHTSHHATSYHHFQPDSLGMFLSRRYDGYKTLFLDAMNEIISVNILTRNVKSTFNANIIIILRARIGACKNYTFREHERAMQKVQWKKYCDFFTKM